MGRRKEKGTLRNKKLPVNPENSGVEKAIGDSSDGVPKDATVQTHENMGPDSGRKSTERAAEARMQIFLYCLAFVLVVGAAVVPMYLNSMGTSETDTVQAIRDELMRDPVKAFAAWVHVSGIRVDGVAVHDRGNGSLHLVASKSLQAGHKVIEVPGPKLFSCFGYENLWKLLPKRAAHLDKFCAAMRMLIDAPNSNSQNYAFLRVLPHKTAMRWDLSEEEVAEIQVPHVVDSVQRRLDSAELIYTEVFTRLHREHPDKYPREVFSLEALQRAFATYHARGTIDGLPPFISLADFDPKGEVMELRRPHPNNPVMSSISVTTSRSYEPGEPFTINYGHNKDGLENVDMWGYVPPLAQDFTEVSFGLSPKSEDDRIKTKLTAALGLSVQKQSGEWISSFILRNGEIPEHLMEFGRVAAASMSGQYEEIRSFPAERFRRDPVTGKIDQRLQGWALLWVLTTMQSYLKRFPTRAKQDFDLLTTGQIHSPYLRTVVQGRLQVKTIYLSVAKAAEQQLLAMGLTPEKVDALNSGQISWNELLDT